MDGREAGLSKCEGLGSDAHVQKDHQVGASFQSSPYLKFHLCEIKNVTVILWGSFESFMKHGCNKHGNAKQQTFNIGLP